MLFADEAHLTAWKRMCAVQGKSASHSVLHIQEHSKVLVGKQMVIVVLLAPSREVIVLGWWTPLSPYALWPTSLEQPSVVSPSIWILELFTSPSAGFSFRQENKGSFSLWVFGSWRGLFMKGWHARSCKRFLLKLHDKGLWERAWTTYT